ncbi:cell division protein FtsQ [Curtobacterium sp. MCBD17_034]|uniref:FtsQ-type POTRA domain-containing protein n=1 Tax=unclassified Curtobacterium TaxID=257496 RepID=UPI000DA8287F|nr:MULTISPECIES: FtsQ-type POTRA domain-containing protein [unclassified Curtobacterium]PZF61039.1 cell division protein FtsQ [Curtobacterium sp. MCBD17_034]PZM40389.1 cell division protein FtsQ [Curtobacterium sp. MCBD17_031]
MKRPEGFDPGSLPVPERPAPPREDRAASDTDASARGGATPGDATPGRAPSGRAPSDGARSLLTGATGQRLGAGITALAGRFRALSPDEDFVDPVAQERAAARAARAAEAAEAAEDPHVDHERPLGAGVRAAETAREARAARRRRRLVERQEVRRFTRRSRHRRAAWLTSGAVLLVLVLSVVVAVYSPLMALRTIEVRGTDRVDRQQVLHAVDGQLGTPLARIDFGAIKRQLAGFPLIASYVTEEAPPHTLVITVTEREPIVAVKTGSGYDLVDPAGIVVESDPKQPAGMPLAAVQPSQLGSTAFRSMTEVVLALPTSVRSTVTQVTASTSDDVTLTLHSGAKVVWGSPDDSAAKARLLAALMTSQAPSGKVEYDVSAPDNGIVRQQRSAG